MRSAEREGRSALTDPQIDLDSFEPENVEIPDLETVLALDLEGDHSGQRLVLYELQPKQFQAFLQTPLALRADETGPTHIGYGGAAGGGKSYLSRAVATAACIKWPGCNGLILRRTMNEVKTNHVKPFRKEVPNRLPDNRKLYSWSGSDFAGCASFTNESDLYFGYMKEDGDELQYQGLEFDFIIFEEATHYLWDQVRYLTGERMRATTNYSRPFALYPSNPGNQGHQWYKRLFIDKSYDPELNEDPAEYTFIQSYVWDNKILLKRDPKYIKKLATLPEPLRSWRLWGDWDAGMGLAVTQIDKGVHLIDPFDVPHHWRLFGAFDWGYSHPFSFGVYAVDEDGRMYKIETITGRRQLPSEIARYVIGVLRGKLNLEPDDLKPVYAGHDCWSNFRSRGEQTPTIAEVMQEHNFRMARAKNYKDRVLGLNNLRKFLAWEEMHPEGGNLTPYLRFFDTQGNRKCVSQIASMPSDPDNPEDALKQDADEYGHGGDDMYDETRYAAASRKPPAPDQWTEQIVEPWSEDTIKAEAERKQRSHMPRSMRETTQKPSHPELGEIY